MDRIGIAASKIAKGNIIVYNITVIALIFAFALFVFLIAGAAIMLGLIIVGYIISGVLFYDFSKDWIGVVSICMGSLTVVVGFFAVMALIRNLKFKISGND